MTGRSILDRVHGEAPGDDAVEPSGVPVDVARRIVVAGLRLDRLSLVASVAGNISERIGGGRIAITRSGPRKGFLVESDVIEVDLGGITARGGGRPSAETPLHCQIYTRFPEIHAVVHGHSIAATVLTRVEPGDIVFEGYEVQKAFDGVTSHAAITVLPVFENDQDMPRLAEQVHARLGACQMGYALRGHGVYAWGRTMEDAMSKLEAVEFLLSCRLAERQITAR